RSIAVAVALAGTGALLLPVARAGEQLGAVATAVSPPLGAWIADPVSRAAVGALWLVAAGCAITAAVRSRQRTVVIDVLLIGALGALAPPLVAFAVWFGGWHAVRHYARLLTLDATSADLLARGQPRRAVATIARRAVWPTLAAVTTLAALLVATATATDPAAATGATLIILLALTVPHMVVVLWLDRRAHRTTTSP
ncbi:MAG: Brp/Blh family beta-carotene 15,15'-dioxygenase, partial [Dermatophilaceae bacterium]